MAPTRRGPGGRRRRRPGDRPRRPRRRRRVGAAGHAARPGSAGGPLTLVVADGDRWWRERDAPLRGLLHPGSPVRVLALADDADRLPAVCSTIVDAGAHGRGHVEHVDRRELDDAVAPLLVDDDVALAAARALARFDDPERIRRGRRVGGAVGGPRRPARPRPRRCRGRRGAMAAARSSRRRRLSASDRPGRSLVDLVADGPHGLVAGTTGSGKSELLRSLVAGLAATLPPDELNLVLVDFKGGAAFDACADLPHTVGLVTDLDEHLAGRVLRCLRAELTHRERVLRAAGASALDELGGPGTAPLPRLLLVIDEFASLSAQLPEFVPGLVEIAQRGRSLGFHLVLATQRPAGVVDQRIKANTDLRIALRVQDEADSVDVVGVRDAAAIPRTRPGRALARFAAGELVELQTASASGAGGRRSAAPLTVRPFVHHRPPSGLERRVAGGAGEADGASAVPEAGAGPSDLRRIVGAIAAAAADRPAPRRPYLDPLPEHVPAARPRRRRAGRRRPVRARRPARRAAPDGPRVATGHVARRLRRPPARGRRRCWRRWPSAWPAPRRRRRPRLRRRRRCRRAGSAGRAGPRGRGGPGRRARPPRPPGRAARPRARSSAAGGRRRRGRASRRSRCSSTTSARCARRWTRTATWPRCGRPSSACCATGRRSVSARWSRRTRSGRCRRRRRRRSPSGS